MRLPSKTSTGSKDRVRHKINDAYNLLYKVYGRRRWWPADTPFEVMVGAVLTQNTNWINVEKAIINLKKEKVLNPSALRSLNLKRLAMLIRPCGYYNIKAKRLKNLNNYLFLEYCGRVADMRRRPLAALRGELLNVKGVGPETADSIILYAIKKPAFVVDAYTRRIMGCLGIVARDSGYDEIQSAFIKNLPRSVKLFNEYHALLVEHGKKICKSRPICQRCILRTLKHG